ncbi:MAG: cytochrome c oxidase subunit 2 [Natronomonas sp.]|jgi:cytochrome c oxidase subunit 2|uniref:cytochrome c oxidase subunit II n=1 Tax=Natronomonas sp. TaxID=2184060 RepID=UPI0039897820
MVRYIVLAHQVPEDWRAQAEVFNEIFTVFLAVGALVGIVVVTYTLYNAYKNRDTGDRGDSFDAPTLGELPSAHQGGKSRKLFFSFGLSAIIVISLVVYSYSLLLYVEEGPSNEVDADENAVEEMQIEVVGIQFAWQFHYPNGKQTFDELRVPEGHMIRLSVTSDDVWHNFGAPSLRVKSDAIPGQYSHTWFIANETGNHTVRCYELCGSGHSQMQAEIIIMEPDEFEAWYSENSTETNETSQARVAPSGVAS